MKKQHKQPPPPPRAKSSPKKTIFVLIAMIALVAGGFSFCRPSTATSTPTPAKVETTSVESDYAKLDAILVHARQAAKGEALAEKLVDDFARQAVIGKLQPDGIVNMTPRRTIDKSEVVVMIFVSKSELKRVPVKLESPFMFEWSINAVVCAEIGPLSQGVLATVLLHELYHWRQFLDRGRIAHKDSVARQLEEVRAHELELRAVDRLTEGKFSQTIQATLRDPRLSHVGKVSPYRYPSPDGEARLLLAWKEPSVSKFEDSVRDSAVQVAWFFAQSANDSEKILVYSQLRSQHSNQDYRSDQ